MPFFTKIMQAFGGIATSTKDLVFRSFLLLYYNQVLGLPASTASFVLLISLIVDAVSDPMVGTWSDNFKHKLGRRHFLMLLSVLPFSLSLFLLLAPPDLSDQGLTIWFLVFTVLTRLSFTFYAVPWGALFAELTDDYAERSSLLAYRAGVGWVVGIVFVWVSYGVIFAAGDGYEQGQLNPDNYWPFAVMSGLCVFVAGLVTTLTTLDQVPYLRSIETAPKVTLVKMFKELKLILKNRDFLFLFLSVLASSVIIGTNQAFENYMNTYFWGFGGEELQYMAYTVIGGVAAFLTIVLLQKVFDKKHLLVGCSIGVMIVTAVPVTLRLLELTPPIGSMGLVYLVVASVTVNAYLATVALVMFASMIADVVDAQELQTGLRQEGLFNAAITFSGKATNGAGILIAGLLIDHVIGLEQGVTLQTVDQDAVWRMAIIDAYVVPLFNVVWLMLAMRYTITREKHAQIRAQLDLRRQAQAT